MNMIELSEEMYRAYCESHAGDGLEVEHWDLLEEREQKAWAAAAHRALFLLGKNREGKDR